MPSSIRCDAAPLQLHSCLFVPPVGIAVLKFTDTAAEAEKSASIFKPAPNMVFKSQDDSDH